MSAFRRNIGTYLVVGPFAILLAFPFYWMLVTMFKEDLDLYNTENVPYVYNPVQWKFWESATTKHVEFLFAETSYPDWLLNTAIDSAIGSSNVHAFCARPFSALTKHDAYSRA